MVFSSAIFIAFFLPIVFWGNRLIKQEYSNVFLLIASLIFYAWGEPYLVLIMVFSIIFNWIMGLEISRAQNKKRRFCLILGIVGNISVLGYYKYAVFFAKTLNCFIGTEVIRLKEIVLPIGISFFTFQAISYIVDVYRGDTEASGTLVNVALYISFFPQLIAGPIVKYKDINKQIDMRYASWFEVSEGFKRFIYGLGKKVLIANVLGSCVDTIYAYDISYIDCLSAWIGAVMYTFQIYYDFSGYSDMAIGLGRMFGFRFNENFNYPYLSRSISEFWRRWHISLGSWFREYVYIPLGGSHKGKIRTYINLSIVFVLTGLWHGADFSFIIWGLYHGFFMVIERLGLKTVLERKKFLSVLYTFFIVNLGWVFFRSENTITGIRYIVRMMLPWRHWNTGLIAYNCIDKKIVFTLICAFVGMGVISCFIPEKIKRKWDNSFVEAIYCVFVLFLSLASIASNTYNPFIYFQF